MSEDTPPEHSYQAPEPVVPLKKLSRRGFLKGSAAAIGAAFLGNEVEKEVTNKFETPNAVFYPYYEEHSHPAELDESQLPTNLDYHFAEGPRARSIKEPSQLLDTGTDTSNLEKLKSLGTSIVIGDIDVPTPEGIRKILVENTRPPFVEGSNGEDSFNIHLMATALLFLKTKYKIGHSIINKIAHLDHPKPDSIEEKVSRRMAFLKAAETGFNVGTGYLAANYLVSVGWHRLPPPGSKESPEEIRAIGRTSDRVYGLMSHTRPFDYLIFLRNAIWAHKLLDLAEKQSKMLGRKTNISYKVGAGHTGVEDFLVLGKDFCSLVLNTYPKEVLAEVVNLNNNPETIALFGLLEADPSAEATEEVDDWRLYEKVYDKQLGDLLAART